MNAPKPISVTIPNTRGATFAVKRLLAHGIPAHIVTKYTNGGRLIRHLAVTEGKLDLVNNGPVDRYGSHTYTWTPPSYEPRPMFKSSDAERFVILATFICQSRADIAAPKDPLMAAMIRIFAEEDEDVPAPGIDHIRGIIDRAVMEAGGAR